MALALGAPFGTMAWGGSTEVLPPVLRAASAGAAAFLLLAGGVMLVRAGDLGKAWPAWPFAAFNILLAVQLALNTAANLAARTEAERFGMGAASILGFLLTLGALVPRRRPEA